jgi:LCP family protein required for cell wall assembly
MALLRIGPRGSRTAVLSIPRDLWVAIPGREDDRINTAYLWGDLTHGDGVALARRTVEQAFGVRVDRVAVVDFSCFQEAVDAAGGLSVDVPQRLTDDSYPIDAVRTTTVTFEPGRQTLTGPQALRYARMRTPDSDFGRIRRQHQLAAAFAIRMEEPLRLLAVAETALARCPGSGTDLSLADLGSLSAMSALGGPPRLQLLDESMVTPTIMASGAQVLLPRWERIRPFVADMLGMTH